MQTSAPHDWLSIFCVPCLPNFDLLLGLQHWTLPLWRRCFPTGFHQSLPPHSELDESSHSGVGAFRCDFTRALFLTTFTTKLQSWKLFVWFCWNCCFNGRELHGFVWFQWWAPWQCEFDYSVFDTNAQLTEGCSGGTSPSSHQQKKDFASKNTFRDNGLEVMKCAVPKRVFDFSGLTRPAWL